MELGKILLYVALGGAVLVGALLLLCWLSSLYDSWKERRADAIKKATLRVLFCERERKGHEEAFVIQGKPMYPEDFRTFIESEMDARKHLARFYWMSPPVVMHERVKIDELHGKLRQYNL